MAESNDVDVADAKIMREKMQTFFAQAIADLDAVPQSNENQRLIDDVAAGNGLPANLAARLRKNGRSMAKTQLCQEVAVDRTAELAHQ